MQSLTTTASLLILALTLTLPCKGQGLALEAEPLGFALKAGCDNPKCKCKNCACEVCKCGQNKAKSYKWVTKYRKVCRGDYCEMVPYRVKVAVSPSAKKTKATRTRGKVQASSKKTVGRSYTFNGPIARAYRALFR